MKEAFATEYFRRVKLVCKSKLNGKNKINALNTWAISLMRYGAGIRTGEEMNLTRWIERPGKFLRSIESSILEVISTRGCKSYGKGKGEN